MSDNKIETKNHDHFDVMELIIAIILVCFVAFLLMGEYHDYGKKHEKECSIALATMQAQGSPHGSLAYEDYDCPPYAVLWMRLFSLTTL